MFKILMLTILLIVSTSFQSALCAPKNMTAKIFYVTNRHWTGKTFDEQRGPDSQHSFGTAELLIPTKMVRADMRYWPTKFTPLGWNYGDAEAKHYRVQRCTREPMAQFFDEVAETLTATKTDEITVMVHGYCNSFDDSLIGTATMESYLKGVVIDYSWPAVKSSIPNLVRYNIAQNNVTWAQQPFSNYIKSLTKRFPGVKINIFCHSMGSRLVVGVLHDLYPDGSASPVFNEVMFSSPDFDAATFANRASASMSAATKVNIYVNPKDKAMMASKIFAGYVRAGAPGSMIDTVRCQNNVKIYDFREFGGGFTDHNIPFELISNMHKYDRPGGRWQFRTPPVQIVRVGTMN